MKKAISFNRSKAFIKASVVLFIALFQVSFFMKSSEIKQTIHRNLAQEVADDIADRPVVRLGSETSDDEDVDDTDLIPRNLPTESTINGALDNYELKLGECVVRSADETEINSLLEQLQDMQRIVREFNTSDNRNDLNMIYYNLSRKLVRMGLLADFEARPAATDSEPMDIARYNIGLSASRTRNQQSTSTATIFLNPEIQSEFILIRQCHLSRLQALSTDEERRAYFQTHSAGPFADALREALGGSPEDLQQLANQYYTQARTADQVTNNQNGFSYTANTYRESSLAIQAIANQIRALETQLAANPSNATAITAQIDVLKSSLDTELDAINMRQRAAASGDPVLSRSENAALLAQAHNDINLATQNLRNLAHSFTSGQPTALTPNPVGATTPSAQNPTISLDFDNSFLTGDRTPIDTTNGMLTQGSTPSVLRRNNLAARPSVLPLGHQPDLTRRPRPGATN